MNRIIGVILSVVSIAMILFGCGFALSLVNEWSTCSASSTCGEAYRRLFIGGTVALAGIGIFLVSRSFYHRWRLLRLARDGDIRARQKLATNTTFREALRILARDKVAEIRLAVAQNPSTPPSAQIELAQDNSREIRLAVAKVIGSLYAAVEVLTHDSDPAVRLALAQNMNIGSQALQQLTRDPVVNVSRAATASIQALEELSEQRRQAAERADDLSSQSDYEKEQLKEYMAQQREDFLRNTGHYDISE
jgi:post-segregation antitoxin (ccd killing protein)